jgi:hypothetical protein
MFERLDFFAPSGGEHGFAVQKKRNIRAKRGGESVKRSGRRAAGRKVR